MKKYFKVLDNDGRSCHGGNFQWSLPTQDSDGNWAPGEWHNYDGDVVLCKSGFHLTDNPCQWSNNNTVTYECEIADDAIVSEYEDLDNKIVVSKVRLMKLFTGIICDVKNWKEQHFVNGKLHRDNDLPALIFFNDEQYWYQNGLRHRDGDLPAVVWADGGKDWYQNGKLHRDNDLPAIVCANGDQDWYQNGKLHRDNDMPAIICANGDQHWYQNGERHRDNDLPAIVWSNGDQDWYQYGKLHRDNDRPAVVYADGRTEFWINGEKQ